MNILNQRGSVLLFVISGIAMAAAIGMGMFYMTSTSSLGQMSGNAMDRAHYLALAGKDYALANWNSRASWNNTEFSLSDTERFKLFYSGDEITSTGIVNKDTPIEARKEIKAMSPSPTSAKREWQDTFENLTNWATGSGAGALGSQGISTDKALDVTGVTTGGFGSGTGSWSFLQLNTGVGGAVNLTTVWQNAGYCLSHDLQVKIKNDDSSSLYFAGITFKIAGSGNDRTFYGISFLRTRQGKSTSADTWNQLDNIPLGIAPEGTFLDPPVYSWFGWYQARTSRPAIVLWKKQGSSFVWLAYKILSSSDFVVDGYYNLIPWSNLQIRLNEAYPLHFTNGKVNLQDGAIVTGQDSGATARISGSPILTSGSWESNNEGILTLSNICIPCPPSSCPSFTDKENLLIRNKIVAEVSGTRGEKTNYIRVYYGDPSHASPAPNDKPTDNDRALAARITTGSSEKVHWPVDNVKDWQAYYDYMTLVTWGGINTFPVGSPLLPSPVKLTERIKIDGSYTSFDTIITDTSFLTPTPADCTTPTTINYSGIALHATGDSATSTYFDDFAIQY